MEIKSIPMLQLHFDRTNPRLPADMLDGEPEELAAFYYNQAVVKDLVNSMLENGFFPHEPMIVKPRTEGGFTVVEGNRRLTSLFAIHDRPEARKIPKPSPAPTKEQLDRLKEVPCVVSQNDEAIRKFIGFRHISGPRTWEPEAKARFIMEEILKALDNGEARPFAKVAAAVGSNVQTVRDAYLALGLLERVDSESRFDFSQVQSKRFGVWLRLISSPGVREYIGFKSSPEFTEVKSSLDEVDTEHLVEVLRDLTAEHGEEPILNDSRDASAYGMVLSNPIALRTLRKTKDLGAAKTIVEKAGLPIRIKAEARRVDALSEEVRANDYDDEVEDAAALLSRSSRILLKLAKPDEEDDLFK